jgi:CMP-N-acetylneuraminic acid synthetase/spore coat polysaccharide biosynthesis predicted glycosyltransferase SpsG
MKILAVIPARGGSKGIPRKNVRIMVNKPLIYYSINNATASKYITDVIVTTDDDEIKRIAQMYGASVIDRPPELATDSVTLDPVVYHAVCAAERINHTEYDAVITMQPTSPLLRSATLDAAICSFLETGCDTLLSGINRPHLAWTMQGDRYLPLYKERLNRQYLPKNIMETGAFFISKRKVVTENSRFGPQVSIYEVPEQEAVDIDSPQDWWVAERELIKKRIIIRVEGYSKIGMGHVYRGLVLANRLIEHEVSFAITEKSDIGIKKLDESHFKYDVIRNDDDMLRLVSEKNCDIVINDILDTDERYVCALKGLGRRVVNFEDLGEGAEYADCVINDLYEKQRGGINYHWGSDFYCFREEFMNVRPKDFCETVNNILIIFGGTDPCNLTGRMFEIAETFSDKKITFTFILGMGYDGYEELQKRAQCSGNRIEIVRNVARMSDYMGRADLAVSSQGRTMLELACMGVPSILLAQNHRELKHQFGYLQNGFINLGLGSEVQNDTIEETLIWLTKSAQIRSQMRDCMLMTDLKNGIERVKPLILGDLY